MLCLNFIFTLNFSELISFLLNTNTSIFCLYLISPSHSSIWFITDFFPHDLRLDSFSMTNKSLECGRWSISSPPFFIWGANLSRKFYWGLGSGKYVIRALSLGDFTTRQFYWSNYPNQRPNETHFDKLVSFLISIDCSTLHLWVRYQNHKCNLGSQWSNAGRWQMESFQGALRCRY